MIQKNKYHKYEWNSTTKPMKQKQRLLMSQFIQIETDELVHLLASSLHEMYSLEKHDTLKTIHGTLYIELNNKSLGSIKLNIINLTWKHKIVTARVRTSIYVVPPFVFSTIGYSRLKLILPPTFTGTKNKTISLSRITTVLKFNN